MAKPVLSDRHARWYLQLQQFDITYVPQKAVIGQVLADFLADHSIPAEWELSDYLPDEDVLVIEVTPPWKMYFDGASHKERVGPGVGLDVVGPLTKSSGGHLYILAATDYFSKWAEAVPLKEVKKENVADFIRTHIIYHYGVPRHIITDNGKPFCNSLIDNFNKTLCNLLKKVVAKSKSDWYERIEEALWAYRTTVRTPTQATPYALVYGVEAVLPLEQQIPSLRIAIQGLTEEKNAQIRLEELEALDEKRLEA
ncbi:hypothetical protein Sango_2784400 [Sesamum angolense]|uniref:Integrase catalytic domain-containing protein n=1 Tax=Sesamum angolense TaxID=2727404 RepID=A0AAE1T6Z6_9LAMI|nr:hypothetical protein Sango_2784400 [Sesamum angolense]